MKSVREIEKIGREMPYSAPSQEFFDNFKTEMAARVAAQESQNRSMPLRGIIPMIAVAASLLIGLFIVDIVDHRATKGAGQYLGAESIDQSIDTYFNNLSDDELAYLVDRSSTQDDFYLTLPINE